MCNYTFFAVISWRQLLLAGRKYHLKAYLSIQFTCLVMQVFFSLYINQMFSNYFAFLFCFHWSRHGLNMNYWTIFFYFICGPVMSMNIIYKWFICALSGRPYLDPKTATGWCYLPLDFILSSKLSVLFLTSMLISVYNTQEVNNHNNVQQSNLTHFQWLMMFPFFFYWST